MVTDASREKHCIVIADKIRAELPDLMRHQ